MAASGAASPRPPSLKKRSHSFDQGPRDHAAARSHSFDLGPRAETLATRQDNMSMPTLPRGFSFEGVVPEDCRPMFARKRYAFLIGILLGGGSVLYVTKRAVEQSDLVGDFLSSIELSALRAQVAEQVRLLPEFNFRRAPDPGWSEPKARKPGRPGLVAVEEGVRPHYPVIMIPGIISTGLEMWAGRQCAASYFRQRLWGTLSMLRLFTLDRECWLAHMELDGLTGADPEGVRIRAAQGFEAADYVVGGYWVWALLIESLADVGYSPSNMHVAAYDWRLPYRALEERDFYFTRLRSQIEMFKQMHGRKVAVVGHSMGANVWFYFMQWIKSPEGGKLSSAWVSDHVDQVVMIGAPWLGAPKTMTGLYMGESRDFTYLTGALGSLVDAVMSPVVRRRMMRAWPSVHSLLPMGGNTVWGDAASAPDDPPDIGTSHGALLQRREGAETVPELTMDEVRERLEADALRTQALPDDSGEKRFRMWYDLRVGTPDELVHPPEAAWVNPLKSPLPFAPNLTIHCLYGVGISTERSYVVDVPPPPPTPVAPRKGEESPAELAACAVPETVPYLIDRSVQAVNITNGVRLTDGDGTIPLLSLGYTCERLWRQRAAYNPSRAKLVTREYKHQKSSGAALRGGPESADHVDIMGNAEMIGDILRIVGGQELQDRVISDIARISDNLDERLFGSAGRKPALPPPSPTPDAAEVVVAEAQTQTAQAAAAPVTGSAPQLERCDDPPPAEEVA